MEKPWKFMCLCLVVLFFELCNGLPIHLESNISADPSLQLLSEVIVILLTVCTVLILVGCLCCHRPNGFKEFRDSPVAVSTVTNVDNGLVNPSAEGAFTIFAPLGHQNFSSSNDKFHTEEGYSYGDINVSSWFNEGAFDFPRTKLKYIKELGKGWFGSVVEGTAQDPEDQTWTPVVVRILDSSASTKEKVFFLHEAEIYKCGNHTNLLKLHGRCLNSDPFLLLQELCTQGDLKSYLQSNKSNNNLQVSEYPLVWCCQISSALKFLHEKGLAHSDLACRNCQLTSNLTVKLGDYGLSPTRYPEDYYEGVPTISVRWCAPESIRHTNTTIQPERITREANVWSLAVCFWEICECGTRPYTDLTDDEVVTQVLGKAHVRLPRPKHVVLYTDYIYNLMQSCWLTPESRPTSTQIYLTLTDLLQVFTICKSENNNASDLQESQESFDLRWNSLKPNKTVNYEAPNTQSDVKQMSPSMNNLIGSLEDMNRSRTSEEDNAHSVLLPGRTNKRFEFELSTQSKEPLETDSLDDSMVYNMRRSSSSETEEENWKKKIERGAYTEKVRQKSRSVTDLMVLTHIDCSESESETPQPSLDHRVNYKNVRMAPKHNLESSSYIHGSEGNLLSVQDDFQAELRKLQEEHRDSLFFVPDKYSQTLRNEQVNNNLGIDRNICIGDSSNERLIKELSGTSDITPVNQVFNVFNVTIDKLSPIHVVKLNEIINLEESLGYGENKTFVSYEVPKLCDIIENNSMVANIPDTSIEIGDVDTRTETLNSPENITSVMEIDETGLHKTENLDIENDISERSEGKESHNPRQPNDMRRKESLIDDSKPITSVIENYELENANEHHKVLHKEQEVSNLEILGKPLIIENLEVGDNALKTEESHMKKYFENRIDNKHDVSHVPDNQLETVLNDQVNFYSEERKEDITFEKCMVENEDAVIETLSTTKENYTDPDYMKNECSQTVYCEKFQDTTIQHDLEDKNSEIHSFPPNEDENDTAAGEVQIVDEDCEPDKEACSSESYSMDEDSVNGKKMEESSLDILNENKNTLENLFVFQMGENLESFEMNSQISDMDLSSKSEICKETMAKSEEKNQTTVNIPSSTETYSHKTFLTKREDTIKNNCQENTTKSTEVPKLIEIIKNDGKLMDYITHYESELHDDSRKTETVTSEEIDNKDYPVVTFDLSTSQEATNPSPLTHLNAFSSLRTKPKSSLELISSTPTKPPRDEEDLEDSNNLNYSLETWDNFLGNAIDTQTKNINDQAVVFESLSSEPRSLMFIETEAVDSTVTPPNSDTEASLDGGFLEEVYSSQTINIDEGDDLNKTSVVEDVDLNVTYILEGSLSLEEGASDDQDESGTWESTGGWFLHPQSSVSGQLTEQRDVRSMDDEVLAALGGELLAKLPHAQGSNSDKLKDNDEEWDTGEREEVFLRYNVYNTPLSPIPEESENEEYSDYICTASESCVSGASDDWPEKLLDNVAPQENDSQSLKAQGLHQHHTLSQDSCCSNDTLFNLEDMTFIVTDQDDESDGKGDKARRLEEERIKRDAIDYFKMGTSMGVSLESPILDLESPMEPAQDKAYLADFLVKEREHSEMVSVLVSEPVEENQSDSNSSRSAALKTAAPLPSPDDHPWKQLSDSLLREGILDTDLEAEESPDSTTYVNIDAVEQVESETPIYSKVVEEYLPVYINANAVTTYHEEQSNDCLYENLDIEKDVKSTDGKGTPDYVNVFDKSEVKQYENVARVSDGLNEEDYVNITNLENAKISADLKDKDCYDVTETPEYDELIIRNDDEQDDQLLGVLTDIRFSGPGESHLMSTSFSESNEIPNEQNWESGSDARSGSGGEFIWREGEHEESLKALQALPQDLLDDIEPSKGSRDDTSSESSCSDDEGECPEFIPSAWDKYATPTKSALRSPEKTLEREEKKKGVWFKKQRYHCVYEYPKEPDSPVLQSFDLWNNPPSSTTYPEWYFDIAPNTECTDFTTTTNFSDGDALSTDFTTSFNNEFFVTGSATPFDMMSSTSSQFFPGGDHWSELSKLNENTTPDSGVEDITPGSMDRVDFSGLSSSKTVPSLKVLCEAVYARTKQKENKNNEILGGLRHTRDKLKLDLPSSPNTFTSNKTFNLEPNIEPVVIRERPAFTTFGKSRFLVQHVDTPDKDIIGKNVCFDALPYKPIEKKEAESRKKKIKKDEEKGEASLLDSADEDSGIESSTLERKSSNAGKLIVDL